MKYRAVVFDLDGTLINSLDDIVSAFNAVLKMMDYPMLDRQTLKEKIGEPLKERIMSALPKAHKDEGLVKIFRDHYKHELRKRCIENSKPYDGILEILTELKKRDIKIGILTNKREDIAKVVINELLLGLEFDSIRGAGKGIPEKPDPTAAYLIAEDLKVRVVDIIYVGDTKTDVETAKAAGMSPVGVSWGFQSVDTLIKYGAKIILEHPFDLLEILAR